MNKEAITSPDSPAPIGPYSPAIAWHDLIFLSGQGSRDPVTGAFSEDIAQQTRQALANVETLLTASGSSKAHVLKLTVYMTNLKNFETMNAIYAEFFAGTIFPARTTVQVAALPKGIGIEIDAIALRNQRPSDQAVR